LYILAACPLFLNLLLYILDANKGDWKTSFIYSSSLHISVWLCRPQVKYTLSYHNYVPSYKSYILRKSVTDNLRYITLFKACIKSTT